MRLVMVEARNAGIANRNTGTGVERGTPTHLLSDTVLRAIAYILILWNFGCNAYGCVITNTDGPCTLVPVCPDGFQHSAIIVFRETKESPYYSVESKHGRGEYKY